MRVSANHSIRRNPRQRRQITSRTTTPNFFKVSVDELEIRRASPPLKSQISNAQSDPHHTTTPTTNRGISPPHPLHYAGQKRSPTTDFLKDSRSEPRIVRREDMHFDSTEDTERIRRQAWARFQKELRKLADGARPPRRPQLRLATSPGSNGLRQARRPPERR